MQLENVEFVEALKMLAEKAGVELAANSIRKTNSGAPDDKQTLYRACDWAVGQFHQFLLQSPLAKSAREYLSQRHFNDQSIQKYHVGYAPPEHHWLLNRAKATEFSAEVLQAAGLVYRSTSGRFGDRFRGRVLFPILDPQRRAVGIGGRILPEHQDENTAKYINSPETILYAKSDQLYGLDVARDTQPVKRDHEMIVMEGYTDVIIANQFGLENVVAVCGTSLTEGHIRVLRRFADRIVLVLDGDEAGRRKANAILNLFVANQIDLRIVTLPDGLDPCDFVIKRGAEGFREIIATAPDALEHKIRLATQGIDVVRDTHQANRALQELLTVLAAAPRLQDGGSQENHLRQQQILAKLASKFRIDEIHLRGQLSEIRSRARTKPSDFSSRKQSDQRNVAWRRLNETCSSY